MRLIFKSVKNSSALGDSNSGLRYPMSDTFWGTNVFGEESGATQWGLTLSLKVPFGALLKISNSWLHLLLHFMFWPGKADPAARWMQQHLVAVLQCRCSSSSRKHRCSGWAHSAQSSCSLSAAVGASGRRVCVIFCFGFFVSSSSSVSLSQTCTTTLGVDSVPACSSYFSPAEASTRRSLAVNGRN